MASAATPGTSDAVDVLRGALWWVVATGPGPFADGPQRARPPMPGDRQGRRDRLARGGCADRSCTPTRSPRHRPVRSWCGRGRRSVRGSWPGEVVRDGVRDRRSRPSRGPRRRDRLLGLLVGAYRRRQAWSTIVNPAFSWISVMKPNTLIRHSLGRWKLRRFCQRCSAGGRGRHRRLPPGRTRRVFPLEDSSDSPSATCASFGRGNRPHPDPVSTGRTLARWPWRAMDPRERRRQRDDLEAAARGGAWRHHYRPSSMANGACDRETEVSAGPRAANP
jgi:hypothetical protein